MNIIIQSISSDIGFELAKFWHNEGHRVLGTFRAEGKNTKELTNLREKIYELKKFKFLKKYSPHISLAYGNHETGQKHFLISKLPKLPIFLRVSRISIVEVNESKNLWNIIETL